MAQPDEIPTDLTLDVSDALSPEEFLLAVRNFIGYVAEITAAQAIEGEAVHWTVKVRQGSNLIGVEPDAAASPSRVGMIYRAARHAPAAIASGDVASAGVTEKAVAHLKALADLAVDRPDVHVALWVQRERVAIGHDIKRQIEEDAESEYQDWGALEGRLDAIQDKSGRLKIRVRDLMYRKPVACRVPESLIAKVMAGFRRRVEIEGLVHFRPDGTPLWIDAERIEILPEDSELPDMVTMRGLLN